MLAVVTETWFKDGGPLEERREEVEKKMGLSMLTRNRDPNDNGVAYGGVALLWRGARASFKEVHIKSNKYEVLVGPGR